MAGTPKPYFLYPFAIDSSSLGVGSVIPNTGSDPGSASYQEGFTTNYELDLSTDASALPIPRDQTNQLFFDITTALQQLQLYGVPNWIASGSGGPASYPLYATVLYIDGNIYQSQIASNTSVPGADQNWLLISGQSNSVPIGTIIDFAGTTPPSGFIICDGTAISRSSPYAKLFNAIVATQSCTSTNSSANLTVVSSVQMYAGMAVEGAGIGIPAGTTIASITNSTTIVLSNTVPSGAGTGNVLFFNWGNGDGSTTFNVPDFQNKVSAGCAKNGYAVVDIVGQSVVGNDGGSATYTLLANDLPPHTHDLPVYTGPSSTHYTPEANFFTSLTSPLTTSVNSTANNPIPIVQPTALVYKCIKYN